TLADQVVLNGGRPREIAAGSREAGDEPVPNRIGHSHEHNRDHRGRLFRGQGMRWAAGHDDINLQRSQLGRERLPLGVPALNHEIAALDVAELTQSLAERLIQVGGGGAIEKQVAYSSNLGRLLGLGRNRAAQPSKNKGDTEDNASPSHLDSTVSNS